MKSKADLIRTHLKDLRVLDVGGCGYRADNPYERDLAQAWACAKQRTVLDCAPEADIACDLNLRPLPSLAADWDIATAFDVLEHLEAPVQILRWLPTPRLLVSLPNALSPLCRRLEERGMDHLYSFTGYTAARLLERGGWRILTKAYTMGKWSLAARVANAIGSCCPALAASGLMFDCERSPAAAHPPH